MTRFSLPALAAVAAVPATSQKRVEGAAPSDRLFRDARGGIELNGLAKQSAQRLHE